MNFDREPARPKRKNGIVRALEYVFLGFSQAGAVEGLMIDPELLRSNENREESRAERWPYDDLPKGF